MILALELVGAYLGGAFTIIVAAGVIARRKMREMRKMMQGFPFPQA